jgi:TetR/AcrR family transcriptional repressor of nem operon
VQASVAYCLRAAVAAGELPADFACDEVAGFVVSSLQGANLLAKAQRSPAPVERFKQILFSKVLR